MSATNTMQAFLSVFTADTDGVTPVTGIVDGGGSATMTQTGSPSMSMRITSAAWLIPGPAPTTQGPFLWTPGTSTQTVGPFDASDPTNPRIDLITAQVLTPGDATTAGDAGYVIVKGTPASSPAAPPLPTGAAYVGQALIGAGVTSIVTANLTGATNRSVAKVRKSSDTPSTPSRTGTRLFWGTVTATTSSSGYITWTHNSGVTPAAIMVEPQSPISGSVIPWGHVTDTITSTTARTRFAQNTGAIVASTSVTFRWFAAY